MQMYAWVVLYRKTRYDEFYASGEAYWTMAEAERFIRGRANSPKPAHGWDDVLCYQYMTEAGEEYLISEVHLPAKKEG